MVKHKFSLGWGDGGASISKGVDIEAGGATYIDESISAAVTDREVAFVCDVSQLKGIFIVSDQDLLLQTNDGASPVNVITLTANRPFLWFNGMPALRDTAGTAITTDITAIFATNAGASAARLQIRALLDPTV